MQSCVPFRRSFRREAPKKPKFPWIVDPASEISDVNILKVAHAAENPLHQKILDKNLKIRDAAARIYTISQNFNQSLDASKTLLVTNSRITACLKEIQKENKRRVQETSIGDHKSSASSEEFDEDGDNNQNIGKGQLCISGIRVPLLWKDGIRIGPDYSVFCLLRVGLDIQDTQLSCGVGPQNADVEFKDIVLFENVLPDFKCTMEVYGYKKRSPLLRNRLSAALTDKELTSGLMRQFSQRGGESGKNAETITFDIIGRAILSLDDVTDDIRSHVLSTSCCQDGKMCDLPTFGSLCCRLAAQPYSVMKPVVSATISVEEKSSGDSHTCYMELQNRRISCWYLSSCQCSPPQMPSVHRNSADLVIPVVKTTDAREVEDPENAEKSSKLAICSYLDDQYVDSEEYLLSFDNPDDCKTWCHAVNNHIRDQVYWRHAFENMEIHRPTSLLREGSIVRANSLMEEGY